MNSLRLLLTILITMTLASGGCASNVKVDKVFSDAAVVALVEAAFQGNKNKVKALIADGADINTQGVHEWTPLFVAMLEKNKRGYAILLELGADASLIAEKVPEPDFVTAIAATQKDSYWLEMAIKHGANLDAPSKSFNGLTPVFFAIRKSQIDNYHLLAKAGANVGHAVPSGETPLSLACKLNRYEIAFDLLERGVSWDLDHPRVGNKIVYYIEEFNSLSNAIRTDENWTWFIKTIGWLLKDGATFSESVMKTYSAESMRLGLIQSREGQ